MLQLAECCKLLEKIDMMVCCNSPSAVDYNRKSILWRAHYFEFLSSVAGHMGVLTCRPRVTLASKQMLHIPRYFVFISVALYCRVRYIIIENQYSGVLQLAESYKLS